MTPSDDRTERSHVIELSNKEIRSRNLIGYLYSWTTYSVPRKYFQCDATDLAIRRSVFEKQEFIDCIFEQVDASDSVFIDCKFTNCSFKGVSFHRTSFLGTIIEDSHNAEDLWDGATLQQSRFASSTNNQSSLIGVHFRNVGLRYATFRNTSFLSTKFDYSSLEDVQFIDCTFDELDLRQSSCRGASFQGGQAGIFSTTLEKALGYIGIWSFLQRCPRCRIKHEECEMSDLAEINAVIASGSNAFLEQAKLFEFINIMIMMYETQTSNIHETQACPESLDLLCRKVRLDGYSISDLGLFLYEMLKKGAEYIAKSGKQITQDSILYILKLIQFTGIKDYLLLQVLSDLVYLVRQTSNDSDVDQLITPQIDYLIREISKSIRSHRFRVEFTHHDLNWGDFDKIKEFHSFNEKLLHYAGVANYQFRCVQQGSINSIFEFVEPLKLIAVVAILGVRFEKSDKRGISFVFDPLLALRAFGDFLLKIKELLPIKEIDISQMKEDVFDKMVDRILKDKDIIEYIKKNHITGGVTQVDASELIDTGSPKILKNTPGISSLDM